MEVLSGFADFIPKLAENSGCQLCILKQTSVSLFFFSFISFKYKVTLVRHNAFFTSHEDLYMYCHLEIIHSVGCHSLFNHFPVKTDVHMCACVCVFGKWENL